MKKTIFYFLIFCFTVSPLLGYQVTPPPVARSSSSIQVVPVTPAPENKKGAIKIMFPRAGENRRKTPVNVQVRLKGFRLGEKTSFEREEDLYQDPNGQTIHLIVDNQPYFAYHQTLEDGFEGAEEGEKDTIVSFWIPQMLTPGQHILRVFPVSSYGESVRGKEWFDAQIFYFLDQKMNHPASIDLHAPYLTYNEPQGTYPRHQSEPILLDFLVSNCTLSSTGYKVRLTIDKVISKFLTKEVPYYIYGLDVGKHLFKLELLDERNQIVPGFFNIVEREFYIKN